VPELPGSLQLPGSSAENNFRKKSVFWWTTIFYRKISVLVKNITRSSLGLASRHNEYRKGIIIIT
jgi:hypothetical protein